MAPKSLSSVKVQQEGNNLVAAYHTASPPIVWKFDLDRNHSFSVVMQGQDNNWELGVTSPKEAFHSVARFLSRDDAEEAFIKTQKALLTKKGNKWKSLAIVLMVVVVLLFIMLLLSGHHSAGTNGPRTPLGPVSSSQQKPMAIPEGEPVDADHALRPPPP